MQPDSRSMLRLAPLVVVLRVALVALAATAVVAALWLGRGRSTAAAHRYVCPMHGEVTSSHPGDCPICGMALELADAAHHVTERESDDVALSALRSSPEATNLMRFSVAQARRNVLAGEVFAPAIAEADGTITARLYRDELQTLGADEHAELIAADALGRPLEVERDREPPVVHATLADVKFRPVPGVPPPAAGRIGWIKLAYKTRDMLVVRASSVIQSADGPYVLVFSAERGSLGKRKVEVGKEWDGMAAIVGGLRDKEFVIMANTFSFDAERRLRAAP